MQQCQLESLGTLDTEVLDTSIITVILDTERQLDTEVLHRSITVIQTQKYHTEVSTVILTQKYYTEVVL